MSCKIFELTLPWAFCILLWLTLACNICLFLFGKFSLKTITRIGKVTTNKPVSQSCAVGKKWNFWQATGWTIKHGRQNGSEDCSIGESAARKPSFSLAAVCDAKFHCSVAHQNFPLLATGLCWFTLLESGLYVCITEIMGKAPCTEWQLFTDIGTVHAQLVANYTDNRHASYTTYGFQMFRWVRIKSQAVIKLERSVVIILGQYTLSFRVMYSRPIMANN